MIPLEERQIDVCHLMAEILTDVLSILWSTLN